MTGFTNAGFGGKCSAAISVTYPPGATCKCASNNRTLSATDQSGKMLFLLPEIGTWTITISNGTQTATTNVSISEKSAESASIFFVLMLYNNGDMNESVTGGWSARGLDGPGWYANPPYIEVRENSIMCHARYLTEKNSSGLYECINDIDLTPYKKLKIRTNGTVKFHGSGYYLAVMDRDIPNSADSSFLASIQIEITPSVTELDISDINGYHDIGVLSKNFYSASSDPLIFTEVWLESGV